MVLTHTYSPPRFRAVGRALLERLKQTRPLPNAGDESLVNLLLAARWVEDELARRLAPLGLTHPQYNVLRILRGVHPGSHPRCEIAARLIVRSPDVTRLVDRLVRRGLVTRGRGAAGDRRQSVARITARGLALLERSDAALEELPDQLNLRLGRGQLGELSRLCERLWSGSDA
jgi:DNA-binding MarR family transcriptional regulator